MSKRRAVLAVLALVTGLSPCGCATTQGSLSDLPVTEYAGHYTAGDEESWFRPCGAASAERPWWVTFTEASV